MGDDLKKWEAYEILNILKKSEEYLLEPTTCIRAILKEPNEKVRELILLVHTVSDAWESVGSELNKNPWNDFWRIKEIFTSKLEDLVDILIQKNVNDPKLVKELEGLDKNKEFQSGLYSLFSAYISLDSIRPPQEPPYNKKV